MISSATNRLFSPGGCLTAMAMRNYLEGSLRLSGKLQVEEHLKKCRICSQAIEGLKLYGRKGFIQNDLEYLNKRIRQTYATGRISPIKKTPVLVASTLAVLLLLILGVFLIFRPIQPAQNTPGSVLLDSLHTAVPAAADTIKLVPEGKQKN
jgi:hypothetical protein